MNKFIVIGIFIFVVILGLGIYLLYLRSKIPDIESKIMSRFGEDKKYIFIVLAMLVVLLLNIIFIILYINSHK